MNKEQTLILSGLFEIDSDGTIWRIAKRHGRGVKPGGGYYKGAATSACPKVRAEYKTRDGYLLVTATINKRKIVTGAHRIVWTYFNRSIPRGLTINHKDGVKDRNKPDNLELATYREQRLHALNVLHRRRWHPVGALHPKTHLSEVDVLEMRRLRDSGLMVKDIADRYNMTKKATSAICCRRTWKHI